MMVAIESSIGTGSVRESHRAGAGGGEEWSAYLREVRIHAASRLSRWPPASHTRKQEVQVALPDGIDPAAVFEDLFESNGWRDSWRNGVYDYLHYHSRIHEVMGVARGTAVVQFGGRRGRKVRLKSGDVVALPAGAATGNGDVVGHETMGEVVEGLGPHQKSRRACHAGRPDVCRCL
jgi:mannose-6-phosphate isomerase-like protein (cupin superfamily)